MYNVCNTGVNNRQGGCSYGYWNGCGQRVCRDCCGNLIVYNRTACGCCQQLCGNGTGNDTTQQNNGNTGTNGNGVFRCVTFCGYIIISGIALLVLYFIRMLLNYFIQYKGHVMGVRMQAEMRSEMFAHLEKLPFGYFDGQETGKLMSRMTNDLMNVAELAHHGPENVIISAISIIIAFAYLAKVLM